MTIYKDIPDWVNNYWICWEYDAYQWGILGGTPQLIY